MQSKRWPWHPDVLFSGGRNSSIQLGRVAKTLALGFCSSCLLMNGIMKRPGGGIQWDAGSMLAEREEASRTDYVQEQSEWEIKLWGLFSGMGPSNVWQPICQCHHKRTYWYFFQTTSIYAHALSLSLNCNISYWLSAWAKLSILTSERWCRGLGPTFWMRPLTIQQYQQQQQPQHQLQGLALDNSVRHKTLIGKTSRDPFLWIPFRNRSELPSVPNMRYYILISAGP